MLAANLHLVPSYTSLPNSPLRHHDNFLQSANYMNKIPVSAFI